VVGEPLGEPGVITDSQFDREDAGRACGMPRLGGAPGSGHRRHALGAVDPGEPIVGSLRSIAFSAVSGRRRGAADSLAADLPLFGVRAPGWSGRREAHPASLSFIGWHICVDRVVRTRLIAQVLLCRPSL
jgi:hypothetical protein